MLNRSFRKKNKRRCRVNSQSVLLLVAMIEIVWFHWYSAIDFGSGVNTEEAHLPSSSSSSSTTTTTTSSLQDRGKRTIIEGDGSDNNNNDDDDNDDGMSETMKRNSRAGNFTLFEPFRITSTTNKNNNDNRHYSNDDDHHDTKGDVNTTIQILKDMGVKNLSEWGSDRVIQHLPDWSRVLKTFGEEPVILGLERCAAYRAQVPSSQRLLAPAGMFSSGTNLLQELLSSNCIPPPPDDDNDKDKDEGHRTLTLWQTPWGKHNPASARLNHAANHMVHWNQSAVLPIVCVRHPYTWMYALCQHPYSLRWHHNKEKCEGSLYLNHRVKANLKPVPVHYDSLAHVWRDWYSDYFTERSYPLLMARLEDIVYRPQQVVAPICACVGGTMRPEFEYQQESANKGKGHGKHRSDLVAAFVKFGLPLELFEKNMFTSNDWNIIRSVLKSSQDMMKALRY